MNLWAKRQPGLVAVGVWSITACVLWSVCWASRPSRSDGRPVRENDSTAPTAAHLPAAEPSLAEPPVVAPSAPFWLFSAPVLERDAATGRIIARRKSRASPAPPRGGFGVELVALAQPPFRLQLVGFVGEAGAYRGIFRERASGRTVVAPGGHELRAQGVRVERLTVQRAALPESRGTPRATAAVAQISDLLTGTPLELSTLTAEAPGPIQAQLRLEGADETRWLAAGQEFPTAGAIYRVESLELNPPHAMVQRLTAAGEEERRRLTLAVPVPTTLSLPTP